MRQTGAGAGMKTGGVSCKSNKERYVLMKQSKRKRRRSPASKRKVYSVRHRKEKNVIWGDMVKDTGNLYDHIFVNPVVVKFRCLLKQ